MGVAPSDASAVSWPADLTVLMFWRSRATVMAIGQRNIRLHHGKRGADRSFDIDRVSPGSDTAVESLVDLESTGVSRFSPPVKLRTGWALRPSGAGVLNSTPPPFYLYNRSPYFGTATRPQLFSRALLGGDGCHSISIRKRRRVEGIYPFAFGGTLSACVSFGSSGTCTQPRCSTRRSQHYGLTAVRRLRAHPSNKSNSS